MAQLVAKQTLFLFMPRHFLFDIAVYFVQKEKGAEKKKKNLYQIPILRLSIRQAITSLALLFGLYNREQNGYSGGRFRFLLWARYSQRAPLLY